MKKYFLLMILVILSLFVFADGGENDGDKTDSIPPIPTIGVSVEKESDFL
ncbi:MAG TPA: hypothetical protein P5107_04670 [Thermotogota bacterium]|nr:hypothetical protein [Thermotogota bacterium]